MSKFNPEDLTAKEHINLMHSFRAYYPKGINRHFKMMACVAKFSSLTSKDNVDSQEFWAYLKELYNLDFLNSVACKFPNNTIEYDPFEVEELQLLRLKFNESQDKSVSSNQSQNTDKSEMSDDNTLSGTSTPVNVPSKGKNKRQSNDTATTLKNTAEKLESGRRKDRSDSDKGEKHETRQSISSRSRDKEESVKSEKSSSEKSTPSAHHKREQDKDKSDSASKKALRTSNSMVKKLRRYSPAVRDTPYKSPVVTGSAKKKNGK